MRLTTKGRFAVTAMIDLGLRQSNGPVTLAAISQRQQISLSYLEQLFGKLRRHELVESTRGPGGGYSLARKAAEITVADIIVAVEDVPVGDLADFYRQLWSRGDAGVLVELTILREGQRRRMKLETANREDLLRRPRLH